MRIGLVIYGSLSAVSGGYLYDRMLVDHLRRRGDEVDVISLPRRTYGRHLADNFSPGLARRCRRGRFDLLLQDELNHPSLFWFNRSLRGRYPILSLVHHLRSSEARPAWQNWLYGAIERRYLATVDGFVYNSQATRRTVEARVGPRPGLVAHPGRDQFGDAIAAERIRARSLQPGPLKLLFIGNLIPRKGLHLLLDALGPLPGGWHLKVCGSPMADVRYAEIIRRRVAAGMSARVSLLGPQSGSQLAGLLAESHVLVVPSSYEGFGLAYLEGMGFGLPAIGSAAGGAGEIITHGRDGFLVPSGGAAEVAGHLQALIADRATLLAMSLAARERFLRHPTWETTAAQIREFMQQMVN